MTRPARHLSQKLILLGSSILLTVGALELAVRRFSSVDVNGNRVFANVTLRPQRLPVATTRAIVAEYEASLSSRLMYDPELGWTPRPNSHSANDLYYYNSMGIRSAPSEYDVEPPSGVVRIALFGDSYTHGDDVAFTDSWGYHLEQDLRDRGRPVEVLNFGVSCYGMDQAFLRWRTQGRRFQPDIVVFGFDAENVNRNVNLIRAIYQPKSELPLSKPRFVLDSQGELQLVNVPALPPERLVDVLQRPQDWDLIRYEHFIRVPDFQESAWYRSRLVAFVAGLGSGQEDNRHLFALSEEPARLTVAIVSQFRREVEADGHRFVLVHLPRKSHTAALMAGDTLEYADLLSVLAQRVEVLHPEQALMKAARASSLEALYKGHFSPKGSQVLAGAVADWLEPRIPAIP